MFHLNYKHGLGLSFLLLLSSNEISVAKAAKKEVAVIAPIIRKNSAAKIGTTAKNKLKSVLEAESTKSATDDDASAATAKTKLKNALDEENALNRAILEKKLSAISSKIAQLSLEKEHKRLRKEIEEEDLREAHDQAMRLLRMEKEKLAAETELAQAKFAKHMEQYSIQIAELDKKLQLERGQTQVLQEAKNRLQAEMDALQTQIEREKRIQQKPIYLKEPLRKLDNILVLSDRCIELTGYITWWKANCIVDRIQYFNNKNNQYPIFIVIDSSPGGFVSPGFNILQAIKNSKAPVYVVVKEYAASMAALIVTLADRSYAYPNATILHHQPTGGGKRTNVRAAKEYYEDMNKLWERLGGRVAKKMGISLKDFTTKLFQKSIHGDWEEYADNAKKLKWVDFVINGIEDTGMSSFPNAADYNFENWIKKYWGCESREGAKLIAEEMHNYALAPHDFDYSYRPQQQQAQLVGKK